MYIIRGRTPGCEVTRLATVKALPLIARDRLPVVETVDLHRLGWSRCSTEIQSAWPIPMRILGKRFYAAM